MGLIDVGESLRDTAVINLTTASAMVVDDSSFGLDLMCQALRGFGIRISHTCQSAAEAMEILSDQPIDFMVVDCEMPSVDGYELVRWLRRTGKGNAMTPVIMTAAHVRRSKLTEARDCGANFVVTKPFSAATLLERIVWVARDTRPFLEVGDYFGPDRRVREHGPPAEERRVAEIRNAAFAAEQAARAGGKDDI
ncbi:response regulator [Brevundimonas sp. TWP2-3-4b2]|uniref:response regulator n=1 Tax=Brevundimonas sp. TWP2-3-4b2 TaxID=2804595 RepID=UPI003CE94267